MTSSSHPQTTAPTDPLQYIYYPISSLVPGPIRAKFIGTIVNIFGYGIDSTAPKAAKGCLKLLLRDNSAEILVKLWYAEAKYEDQILLGGRLSVSTTHVSTTASPGMDSVALRALPACVVTSIFPERDAGCAIQVHGVDGDKVDGVYSSEMVMSSNLNGLMNLEAFVNGAADDRFYEDVKLLVCVVGVGDLVTISTRRGTSFQVVPVQVLDTSTTTVHTQTGQISRPTPTLIPLPVELSLSSNLASSTKSLIPNQTILLLTSPKLQSQSHRKIKLTSRSQILVNPAHIEALHLRQWVNNLYPPSNISSLEIDHLISYIEEAKDTTHLLAFHHSSTAVFTPGLGLSFQPRKSQHRKQFTWTLFTNQIDLRPEAPFTAYISVIITSLSLVDLWKRNQFFCMPCTHHPERNVYSNAPVGTCSDCIDAGTVLLEDGTSTDGDYFNEPQQEKGRVNLRFNPLLLSGVSDETGGFLISPSFASSSSSPSASHSNFSLQTPLNAKTTFCLPSNILTQADLNRQHHNIYLSDKAVRSLTGLSYTDTIFSSRSQVHPDPSCNTDTSTDTAIQVLSHFQEIESLLLYRRVTLVLGWSGESFRRQQDQSQSQTQSRKKEEFDEETNNRKVAELNRSGRIVVLDVIT